MEQTEGRHSLQRYFSNLNEMTSPGHRIIRSSRIKFEIQNLQDLRNNHWKARRQDLVPKTIDQMQWEAEQEQQMINYQNRQSAKEDRQRGNQGMYPTSTSQILIYRLKINLFDQNINPHCELLKKLIDSYL